MSFISNLENQARKRAAGPTGATASTPSPAANPFGPVEAAPAAPTGDLDPGPIGGFLASAVSSIPELFGQSPTPAAIKFRAENPWMGLASEILPTMVPYAGWYRATESAIGAAALGGFMAKTGIKAAERPILHGTVKETVRFAPFELSRLGVGLATAPEENWGNLFADVGLSLALAGGFGGIGGFFRKGGTTVDKMGRVLDADVGLKPSFQLRLLDEDAGQLVGGQFTKEQGVELLTREALSDMPFERTLKGKQKLNTGLNTFEESGDRAAQVELSSWFKPASGRGVQRKLLLEGAETDLKTLNAGEADGVIAALGVPEITTLKDLAKNFVHPRVVDITSDRGAGKLAQLLDDSGLRPVADGVWMAREADDGLWVQVKRIGRPVAGEGAVAAKNAVPEGHVRLYRGEGKLDPALAPAEGMTARGGYWTEKKAVAKKYGDTVYEIDVPLLGKDAVPNWKMEGTAEHAIREWRVDPAYANQARRVSVEPSGTKVMGASGVAEGDRYFLAKTDKPQLLASQAGKVAEFNLSQWAKMRPGYVSNSNTLFNNRFNAVQDMLPLNDYRDLAHPTKGKRGTWVQNASAKITEMAVKAGDTALTGATFGANKRIGGFIKNSQTAQNMAEGIYDAFKPFMFRATDDPLYGRLAGMLTDSFNMSKGIVNRIIGGETKLAKGALSKVSVGEGYKGHRPFADLIYDLSDEEYRQLVRATQTQTQADDLRKLTTDGIISPKAAQAVEEMMSLNRTVISEDIMPDLVESGLDRAFKPMEEYVAPRIWSGDFKVQVFDEKGRERWLSSAATGAGAQAEAKAVVAEAAAAGKNWKLGPVEHSIERERDTQEFIERITLKNIGSDKEAQDIVQRALRKMDAIAATKKSPIGVSGLAKTMSKERTGRAGSPDLNVPARSDFIKAVENHYSKLYQYTAYHAWANRYMGEAFNLEKINKNLFNDLMRKGRQMLGVPGELTQALDNALKPILGSALGNKPATRLAQQANELMFNWNLAIANPTFALVNLLSPIQTVLPMVSYINSVPDEYLAKFFQVAPRFGSDGKPRGVASWLDPMKIMLESTRSLKNPEPELKRMLEQAKTDGTLSAQMYENWVGPHARGSQTLAQAYKEEGIGKFLYKTATYGATKSEEFARVMSFNAGYHLGKMRGLEGDGLYAFAKRMNEVTNFNYGVVDRSRIFTGPVGSVVGLFKNWQIHYIGMMAEFAGVALKQGAWGPLLWQHAGALGLAGVGGAGLVGAAVGLANWADGGEKKSGSYQWMLDNFGPEVGDALWFGAPGMLGASLQASSAIPGTDVAKELQSLGNVVIWERLKAVGKSVGDAWDYSESTGQNPFANNNIRDAMIAATSPRAFTRLMSSIEGDYVKSMATGYAQVRDVSPATRIMHGLGMNQVEVERQQIAGRELWTKQETRKLETQNLGKALYQAITYNDSEAQQSIYFQAMARGLDLGSVLQSARSINRREEGDLFSRYRKEDVAAYAGAMGLTSAGGR